MQSATTSMISALADADGSVRLKAAMAAGSTPQPAVLDAPIVRCAVEPDFYVRDMLTWALTRFDPALVVPRLLVEVVSECAQARSQALHTLSKIRDPVTWDAITPSLLRDPDEEVAKSAWRAAVALVPVGQEPALAEVLALQFGRGGREMQLSLSRALVALGEDAIMPVLRRAMANSDVSVSAHAQATERLLREPQAGSEFAVGQVKRLFAPGQ